ncbi:MAG: hypothetical protein ABW252_26440 [Polyangiales bacterium]
MTIHINAERLDRAERCIWHAARLLERLRFQHAFRGGPREPVIRALLAYQNTDGGFGHALEPDFRGPVSQPLGSDSALRLVLALGASEPALIADTLRYLRAITTADGGVPNVVPSAPYPRAPWMEPASATPPGSLLPTAGIAGLLHALGVRDPWLERATAFCWPEIEQLGPRGRAADERIARLTVAYEARAAVTFLDHVPDRARAELAAQTLGTALRDAGLLALEPDAKAEAASPLDFAAHPSSLARRWFDDALLDRHLDAMVEGQAEDGGWDVPWLIWTPSAGLEWRGILTVERLTTLRAWGRVQT